MKKVIISSLLFLVVLFAGIAGLLWFFSHETGKMPEKETLKQQQETEKKPTYEEALKTKEEQSTKDIANYNKAVSSRTTSLCESISDEKKKTECRDTIISIQAESSGSLESCSSITSDDIALRCKNSIYQNQAIKSGDKAFCKQISDTTLLTHCRETIDEKKLQNMLEEGTITESSCKGLEEKFQSQCLLSVKENNDQAAYTKALGANNVAYCTLIGNLSLRDTCSDTILLKTALQNNSGADCMKIKDSAKKTYCTSHVATKNEATLFKEYIASSNLSGCATLTDISLKNRCHDMVTLTLVRTNKNSSLCQTLTNTGMIAMCQQSAK